MIQHQQSGLIVFESALYRTTTTLYYNRKSILLVDPNWLPEEIRHIRSHIDRVTKDRKLYLMFTHSDYDHIIGYAAFSQAETIASKAFVDNPDKDNQLDNIQRFDDTYYINRDYEIVYPKVDHIIKKDETEMDLGPEDAVFYHLPGHTKESMIAILKKEGIWILGDYLSNIEFPMIDHDLPAYRKSLQTLLRLLVKYPMKIAIPGHGDVCLDQEDMEKRISIHWDYLDLLEREVEHGKQDDDWLWNCYPKRQSLIEAHQKNIAFCKKSVER